MGRVKKDPLKYDSETPPNDWRERMKTHPISVNVLIENTSDGPLVRKDDLLKLVKGKWAHYPPRIIPARSLGEFGIAGPVEAYVFYQALKYQECAPFQVKILHPHPEQPALVTMSFPTKPFVVTKTGRFEAAHAKAAFIVNSNPEYVRKPVTIDEDPEPEPVFSELPWEKKRREGKTSSKKTKPMNTSKSMNPREKELFMSQLGYSVDVLKDVEAEDKKRMDVLKPAEEKGTVKSPSHSQKKKGSRAKASMGDVDMSKMEFVMPEITSPNGHSHMLSLASARMHEMGGQLERGEFLMALETVRAAMESLNLVMNTSYTRGIRPMTICMAYERAIRILVELKRLERVETKGDPRKRASKNARMTFLAGYLVQQRDVHRNHHELFTMVSVAKQMVAGNYGIASEQMKQLSFPTQQDVKWSQLQQQCKENQYRDSYRHVMAQEIDWKTLYPKKRL